VKAFVDAIIQRFKTDPTLIRYGRRIYEALGVDATKTVPYVDLQVEGSTSELDSFDADFEEFEITFTIFGKDSLSANVHKAMKAMTRVFDDCDLVSGDFETVQFKRTGGTQPAVVDGRYQATLTYTAIVQMRVLSPVTREA
jgi:hypothetical protein